MGKVEFRARAQGLSADEMFRRLRDVERLPKLSPAVRSIRVLERDGDRLVAVWEVEFHGGIMRWTQEDLYLPEADMLRFRQVEGDADKFEGEWSIRSDGDGCIVWFQATFDLGIPGLEDDLEPLAEDALLANVRSVLEGVTGRAVELI